MAFSLAFFQCIRQIDHAVYAFNANPFRIDWIADFDKEGECSPHDVECNKSHKSPQVKAKMTETEKKN